jgi:pimeloyl-ACP methyl ester carboxylesterase
MNTAYRAQAKRERDIVCSVQTEVIAEGDGPPIVMLPSRGRDSEDFNDVAAGIAAEGFRVLRPQLRGIGPSTGPMQNISLHDFAWDVAAAIKDQADAPAVVVGHAFGNWVARMTAVDHRDLVRGVVLAAAAAKTYPPELGEALRKSADLTLPESERLQALQQAFFAPGHDATSWLKGWHPEAMKAQGIAITHTRMDEWWSAGTAPMLDLQAGCDPWRPRTTRNELKIEFGDRVTVAVIPDASHALIPEQPAAVVKEIVAWVRQLS